MLTAEELSRVCAERFEAENHRDVDDIIATLDDGVEYHVMSPSHLDGPEPLGVTAGELRGEEKFLVREFTEVVLETAAGPLQRRVDRIANGGAPTTAFTLAQLQKKLADCLAYGRALGSAVEHWQRISRANGERRWDLCRDLTAEQGEKAS